MSEPAELPEVALLRDGYVAGPLPGANPNERLWRGSGLFDAEGRGVPEVADRMGPPLHLPAPRRDKAADLSEAIFCGRYRGHFGHLVAESLGRVWAAGRYSPDVPLLWFAHPKETSGNRRLLAKILKLFGLTNPVLVVSDAVRVRRLHVPPSLSDPLFGVPAAPAYQDWLLPRLPPPAAAGRDLYLSRSQLGDSAGRFMGEAALEEGLTVAGYKIVHPETLPLARQVALYRGARRIVAAEGSALHLLALLDVPGQEIAVVLRRPRLVASLPATFASFRRGRVHVIDQVRRCWSLTPNPLALFRAVSELDMAGVWHDLATQGFVPPGPHPVPDPALLEAERLNRAADRQVLLP